MKTGLRYHGTKTATIDTTITAKVKTALEEDATTKHEDIHAPRGILARHPANQMLELQRNRRSASLALPAPVKPEALAVPTDEGPRRHDGYSAAPIEPAAEPQQGQTRWMGDPAGLDSALLVETELFAKEEILGRERASGS